MSVERAAIEDAVVHGIDLSINAFMLVHGWTAGPILLQFVEHFVEPLKEQPMTSEELAEKTGAEEGPLAIVLRGCCILKYLSFDSESGKYSLVEGMELEELKKYMGPDAEAAQGLRTLYAEVQPPFDLPSDEATGYLDLWEHQRPEWSKSRSKVLSIFMDGMVLAPLLTSITYSARWDEEGQEHGRDSVSDTFDFSRLNSDQQAALGDIFEQLGVGTMNAKGVVMMSGKGSMALQRCYSYYVPVSYSPLLAQLPQILFDEPSWGFGEGGDDFEMEEHIDRMLNVVGSGAQHRTLFKDLMHHINVIFRGDDFKSQPNFIVDTGCGDGSLLIHIYDYVMNQTQRGKNLDEFPLTMVGVDLNEDPRVTTAVNLSKLSIPHMVISGDVGRPTEIMQALKKKKVNLAKTLHVRSFLDHDRPYIPASVKLQEDSALAAFVQGQFQDFVYLNAAGKRIPAVDLFGSLVEHLSRWADVLEVSFGLCMLEVMMLDIEKTTRFFWDNVSFPLDIVQSLSRQYLVSAMAFAMAGAMNGLFPSNYTNVNTYPDSGKYHRMLAQHLVKKPFKVRFAELSDLPSLMNLEKQAWAENLRASEDVISRRLTTAPTSVLVSEIKGEVVAVLYMQRIDNVAILDQECFMNISNVHSPKGKLLQLIAIAALPELAHMNLGSELKQFALHLARLDSSVEKVVAVTRCGKEFEEGGYDNLPKYVEDHFAGKGDDSTLGFHSYAGAQFVRLVEGYRPEDTANLGVGVLVKYDEDSQPRASLPSKGSGQAGVKTPAMDLLKDILNDLGYTLDISQPQKSFFDYGMDSLELVRIRNKVNQQLDLDLPATLLLDFPTVQDLAMQLDRDRRTADEQRKDQSGEYEPEEPSPDKKGEDAPRWEKIGLQDILEIQARACQVFAQRSYQKRFMAMAKQCFPDMIKYILSIEQIILEVEGPILLERGLVDDLDYKAVQSCREKMTAAMVSVWQQSDEVRENTKKIMHLTLQDQSWNDLR